MAYKKVDPERRERRKQFLELLQDAGITDVDGVKELFKEMVGTVLENGLKANWRISWVTASTTTTTKRRTTAVTATVTRP